MPIVPVRHRCAPALLASMLLLGSATGPAAADTAIRPGDGITRLDLLGDGTPAMMVIGQRENHNAHGFDIASLYLRLGGRWTAMVRFDEAGQEHDQLITNGGADCVLKDFRLIRSGRHRPLGLVVAEREYGETFVDVRPVTFRVYALTHSNDVGRPTWFYQQTGSFLSKASYCDVGEAFRRELPARPVLLAPRHSAAG